MKRMILFAGLCLVAGGMILPDVARAASSSREIATDAVAWVVSDATTGVVLGASNGDKHLQVGSLTKIATAMVVLDWAATKGENLSQMATVPTTIAPLNSPNSIGLAPGDQIALKDALYAALMQSDNQAAETLAVHVGRKISGATTDVEASHAFVAQMNALARQLGMRDTRFLNPHGLDDLEDKLPYSTAHDLALLTNYALGHSGFTFFTGQKERRISWQTAGGETTAYQLRNTNEALGAMGIDGVKTGTTRRAGACAIISAAQRPITKQTGDTFDITPRRLTVVVLGSPNRFETAKALLTKGWEWHDQWWAAGHPKSWKAAR